MWTIGAGVLDFADRLDHRRARHGGPGFDHRGDRRHLVLSGTRQAITPPGHTCGRSSPVLWVWARFSQGCSAKTRAGTLAGVCACRHQRGAVPGLRHIPREFNILGEYGAAILLILLGVFVLARGLCAAEVNMRRDNIFWGTALIILGGLFFLQAQGMIGNVFTLIWPLALILIGGWIILNVYWKPDQSEEETFSVPLGSAKSVRYKFAHGAGQIEIKGRRTGGQAIVGSSAVGMNQSQPFNRRQA